MLSQYAVDHPTLPVNLRYFHLLVMQVNCQAATNQPPDIWNSQGLSGNVFANPRASSSSPCPGEFNPWISNVTEDTPVLTSTGGPVTYDERQIPDTVLNPRFQTGPSAGNSFDPKEGRFSNNYDQTNKDYRSRNFTLTNSLHQQHSHPSLLNYFVQLPVLVPRKGATNTKKQRRASMAWCCCCPMFFSQWRWRGQA